MNINSTIKKKLLKQNIIIEKSTNIKDVKNFIKRFKNNYKSVDLQRIGSNKDGGYLVPNILKDVKYCFSPGVDDKVSFEKFLIDKYGIICFLADANIKKNPLKNNKSFFDKKFLGNINDKNYMTLDTWINNKIKKNKNNLLLQMDIEGGEYDVLIRESSETLKRFNCMVIEFHFFDKIFNPMFYKMINSIFEKIYDNFNIVHVHPNNTCRNIENENIKIPSIIEVTFLRKDKIKILKNNKKIILPHTLDIKNDEFLKDVVMPKIWWKK